MHCLRQRAKELLSSKEEKGFKMRRLAIVLSVGAAVLTGAVIATAVSADSETALRYNPLLDVEQNRIEITAETASSEAGPARRYQVFFRKNSSRLTKEAALVLEEVAREIRDLQLNEVTIASAPEANSTLSDARVGTVFQAMTARDVPARWMLPLYRNVNVSALN
jgi:outer membrane protein OmpA-like peptidoglycan-associated protein